MASVFENSPKLGGIYGDYAKVTHVWDEVRIRVVDGPTKSIITIAMLRSQARALAQEIVVAATEAAKVAAEGAKE